MKSDNDVTYYRVPHVMATVFSVPHLIGSVLWLLTLLILIEVIMTYMIQYGARLSSYHPFVRLVRRIVTRCWSLCGKLCRLIRPITSTFRR